MRIACFAAHPDDEVLGVGGTLQRHRDAGDQVLTFVLYECRTRAAPGTHWARMERGTDPQQGIEDMVHNERPDIVYTHYAGDINADHRRVSEAVRVACRPYAAPSVKRLLEFYTPSSTEWGEAFHPNVYVDITDTLADKVALMEDDYASEMREPPHPRSADMLRAAAAFWGSHVGYAAAEPFVLVRERL